MGRNKTIDNTELLRVAREVFRESGHTATTRDVARGAGISQAVLYQRFGSKEDLFAQAMTPAPPDLDTLLGPYPPRSARADLKRIGERLAEYLSALMPTMLHVLAHPNLGRAQVAKWHAQLPFHSLLSALSARFARLKEDGLVRAIDPNAAAQAFLAAVHSTAMLEAMTHGGSQDDRKSRHHKGQIDAVVDILWTGLAPIGSVREK